MDIQEWKDKYINKFVLSGFTKEDGVASFEAGKDDHEFDEDPEMAASDEFGYWFD